MTTDEIRRANLALLAKDAGGVTKLAERLDRSPSQVSQWLNGSKNSGTGQPRGIRAATCRMIEAACGREPGWLDVEHEDSASIQGFSMLDENTDVVTINRYDSGGSMGRGIVLHDQPGIIDSWRVSRQWLASNVRGYTSADNLAIVTGFGDSMRPTFNPGDPLIVDRGVRSVEFDSVYFFRVADDGYVKRLQRVPTANGLIYRALSDNGAYPPFDIDRTMDFEVLARVVQVWRREDY